MREGGQRVHTHTYKIDETEPILQNGHLGSLSISRQESFSGVQKIG